MADHSKRTGPAVEAHYQFLLWLSPTIERFPKSHKFVFGDRILNVGLDVLEWLVAATITRDRKSHLGQANLGDVRAERPGNQVMSNRCAPQQRVKGYDL